MVLFQAWPPSSTSTRRLQVLVLLTLLLAFVQDAYAYIPALPSNHSGIDAGGLMFGNDTTTLIFGWQVGQQLTTSISYQMAGLNTTGFEKGPLLHYAEGTDQTNLTTSTPWIALVSCDSNATDSDPKSDIFTLAQNSGAIAVLLYSQWSNSCAIDPDLSNPSRSNRPFDIYSMIRFTDSRLIESHLQGLNSGFSDFDAAQLNNTAAMVEQAVNGHGNYSVRLGYLIATLRAANSTVSGNGTDDGSSSQGAKNNSNGSTGLAMIILYAITGCVSALFCIVILTGAIRAIRNPERYGARAADPTYGNPARSRTAGLGQAILDTFPIIKFGRNNNDQPILPQTAPKESADQSMQMTNVSDRHSISSPIEKDFADEPAIIAMRQESFSGEASTSSSSPRSAVHPHHDHNEPHPSTPMDATLPIDDAPVDPDAIGHETCPICILDFEEGDDLRVLPCEGRHRFHQACVDPWLLNMSSSCPLCREDFQTLENMVRGQEPEADVPEDVTPVETQPPIRPGLVATPAAESSNTSNPRRRTMHNPIFSKYLKFAQRRRNRNAGQTETQTTPTTTQNEPTH